MPTRPTRPRSSFLLSQVLWQPVRLTACVTARMKSDCHRDCSAGWDDLATGIATPCLKSICCAAVLPGHPLASVWMELPAADLVCAGATVTAVGVDAVRSALQQKSARGNKPLRRWHRYITFSFEHQKTLDRGSLIEVDFENIIFRLFSST